MLPAIRFQTLITYALFSDKVGVWVFDDRGIHFSWLSGNANDVVSVVDKFRRLCGSPDSDLLSLRSLGRQVYDTLVGPIGPYLSPNRTLVFEGDDAIINLPFEALIDPQGLYLCDRNPIGVSPGLLYTDQLRTSSIFSAHDRALVVDVPSVGEQFASQLPPLPEAKKEAEAVVGSFKVARLLEGSEVNPQNLQREMRDAVVFHYAGHASISQLGPGLLLELEGQPALYDTSRILSESLENTRLVVLSACSTEDGGAGGISDPDSLVRAFLQSGVSQVVASRWSVNSVTTVQFMQDFYKSLLSGKTVVQSLRDAEISIRSHSGTERPYYWAAFGVFGNA
jgi:CHAT domain-containing protein